MNIDKGAGNDNLSGMFSKGGGNILAKPISKICNLSIKYSVSPTDCQVAKLKPLYKKGSTTLPRNYRPLSLLSRWYQRSLKKWFMIKLKPFLDENKICYWFQSGFRKNFSTDLCLSYLNNKIATGFESGLCTGMILIDLQKAFNTINHKILVNKMEYVGFSKEI